MHILWYILWLIFFIWIIKKWKFFKNSYLSTKHLYFLFLIKIAISFAVYGVYTLYYKDRVSSDIFKYYDDGKIMYKSIFDNPINYLKMLSGLNDDDQHIQEYYRKMNFWIKPYKYEIINENKTLIRLNAFISLFSFNNYFVHVLIFAFLSFIGLFAIFKTLSIYLNKNQKLFAYFMFLFPSVLFWSSAILKEALVFFNLGLSLYFLEKWRNNSTLSNFLYFIIFLFLLSISKMYVFILTLPALLFIITAKFLPKLKKIFLYIIIHALILIFFFTSEYYFSYDFSNIVVTKQQHFIQMAKEFNAGSRIEIPLIENSLLSFIQNSPQAIFNALFRPFIWEWHNILALISALENLLIVLLFILFFLFPKKNSFNIWLWFSISFCVLLLTLIGLTTPVLGALVRYKVPCLPFLMFIFFSIIDTNKLYNKLLWIWKKLY